MEAGNILSSNLLDIVFDGRNKLYGAYQLRKEYDKRLGFAVAAMFAFCGLLFISTLLAKNPAAKLENPNTIVDKQLIELIPPVSPPPPPPPPQMDLPEVQVARVTPPVIVADNEVRADELPPENEVIERSRIGTFQSEGSDDLGIQAPLVEERSLAAPLVTKAVDYDYEKPFTRVENPAEFPGGTSEWVRYLQKNLMYPQAAIESANENTVRVQFVVDTEGNISEVVALNDPGDGLAAEAVRIIKTGPKWIPAEQNGRKVKYRHIQSITFRLE